MIFFENGSTKLTEARYQSLFSMRKYQGACVNSRSPNSSHAYENPRLRYLFFDVVAFLSGLITKWVTG